MKKHIFFFFLLILTTQIIYAVGIAQEYVEDNTLKLYPGQERLVKLTMQNPDDTALNVNVTVTGDIVKIQDRQESYLLAPKSYNNVVFLNITVPEDANINDTYNLRYNMAPAKKNKTDPEIKIGIKISQPLYVLVVPEPIIEEEKNILDNPIFLIISLIFVALAFWRLASMINKKM